jgi:hypothetical protein
MYMRMTESEFETYLAELKPEELAIVLLAQFSGGIDLDDLQPAISVALGTAEENGEAPAAVALHLLTLRDCPPLRALAMPDPKLRASLGAFFNFPGTDVEAFLPDFVDVNDDEEVVEGIKHMLCEHRASLLAARAGAGPGVVDAHWLAFTKTHTSRLTGAARGLAAEKAHSRALSPTRMHDVRFRIRHRSPRAFSHPITAGSPLVRPFSYTLSD